MKSTILTVAVMVYVATSHVLGFDHAAVDAVLILVSAWVNIWGTIESLDRIRGLKRSIDIYEESDHFLEMYEEFNVIVEKGVNDGPA